MPHKFLGRTVRCADGQWLIVRRIDHVTEMATLCLAEDAYRLHPPSDRAVPLETLREDGETTWLTETPSTQGPEQPCH